MQYFIAIVGALAGAVLVALFAGIPIANWVVAMQSFTSPGGADDMHSWVFLAAILGGIILGWALGWAIGGRFEQRHLDI